MKNSITEQATRVLHDIDKNLEKQVKHIIVVNALNEKTLDAMSKLLTLVETSRSFGVQKKLLRPGMLVDLVDLACHTYNRLNNGSRDLEIHRGLFANLCRNTYSILQYFGLIVPGKASGTWKITKQGINFLQDLHAVPEYFLCYGGAFRKNYAFDGGARMVNITDFTKHGYLKTLLQQAKPKISAIYRNNTFYNMLPDGSALPTKR